MHLSISKKHIVLICGMLCSIPYGFAQTKENVETPSMNRPASSSAETATVTREIDTLYKHSLDLYQAMDGLLEQIALMLDKDVIKVQEKRPVIQQIRELRLVVDQVRRNTQFDIDPSGLYVVLALQEGLINHLQTMVKNNFKNSPQLDIEALLKIRHIPVELTFEMLQETIGNNSEKLKTLHANATTLGLTWYNKFFRKLADIDHKYRAFTIGGKLAVTACTIAWFYAYHAELFAHENEPKNDASTFSKAMFKIGQLLIGTTHGNQQQYQSFDKQVTVEQIDADGKKVTGIKTIAGAPGLTGLISCYLTEKAMNLRIIEDLALIGFNWYLWAPEARKIQDYAKNVTSLVWGKLLGGVEQMQAEKDMQVLPTKSFDDVVGLDQQKQILMEIVNYIEDPERYDLLGMTPEKGFLLCGPSRTGKSFLAEALAGEIQKMLERTGRAKDDVRFFNIPADAILRLGISQLLNLAENNAPCVLFIDEIDLLGLQRAGGNLELLSQFLSGLSGFQKNNPRKKVIVLAATNKPENIDEALRKSGRFGKVIHFNYPTCEERKTFILRKFESLAININGFDIDKIVEETERCTFEDLNKMLSAALNKARAAGKPLTQEIVSAAFNEEILNIFHTETKNISSEELDILSAHIAGRAVAHIMLECRTSLSCATIRPFGKHIAEQTVFERLNKKEKEDDSTIVQTAIQYGNIFTSFTHDTINLATQQDKINDAKVLLAGNAAETILRGSCGYSYKPEDRQKALDILKKVVFGGIKMEELSKRLREEYLDKCHTLLKQCEQEVFDLLMAHKDELQAVAAALKKYSSLSAEQLCKIIAQTAVKQVEKKPAQGS